MRVVVWSILSLTIITISFSSCPTSLSKICSCEDRGPGFVITCQKLRSDVNTFLSAVEKLRIDRLTVIDASWPVLKTLLRTTVRSIRMVRCGIQEVEAYAFTPVASTLEELILANNSLTKFPLLGNLSKLRILDLNYNKLSIVSHDAFSGVRKLNQLRMEGNCLTELPSEVFKSLGRNLELLDLSNNFFIQVPSTALTSLKNLKYLDLSHNKINIIHNTDFRNMRKIIEIRINDNMLTDIGENAFKDVEQLQYLYIQNNAIEHLNSLQFLKKLNKLEILDLSENSLTKIPNLQNHKNIRQMKLDGNKISAIKCHDFSGNPRLQFLSLQNNEIVSLDEGSFRGLDQLTILLLENNFIRTLDKGMLRGIRKLQQLDLRNNSLNEMENNTFQLVPQLKMIDLAYNGLHHIPRNLFSPLRNIVWLDLSFNVLSSFEEGTFRSRVPHIILVGNPLDCGPKMDWFVAYLVRNQVRTHLPLHPEVSCVSPEKYAGIRIQDLITKKAEDTFNAVSKSFSPKTEKNHKDFLTSLIPSDLSRLIPGLTPAPPPNPVADVPVIGGIAEAVPAIRNIPGLSFIPKPQGARAEEARNLNSAIEQFSTPLLRITSGDSLLLAEDLDQMVKAVPKLAFAPKLDFTQLPSDMVAKAYRGEAISGMSKEAMEYSLRDHVLRVYESAAAISQGKSLLDQPNHLLVLNSVPDEIVADIIKGAKLPHLTEEQTKVVKEYFDVRLSPSLNVPSNEIGTMANIDFPPEVFKLIKFLPPNYDLNKIPKELIDALSRGELPDPNKLPEDLKQHFIANFEELFTKLAKVENLQYEDLIKKLPKFDRVEVATFTPYTYSPAEISSEAEDSGVILLHRIFSGMFCGVSILSVALIVALCFRKGKRCEPSIEEENTREAFLMPAPEEITAGFSVTPLLSGSKGLIVQK